MPAFYIETATGLQTIRLGLVYDIWWLPVGSGITMTRGRVYGVAPDSTRIQVALTPPPNDPFRSIDTKSIVRFTEVGARNTPVGSGAHLANVPIDPGAQQDPMLPKARAIWEASEDWVKRARETWAIRKEVVDAEKQVRSAKTRVQGAIEKEERARRHYLEVIDSWEPGNMPILPEGGITEFKVKRSLPPIPTVQRDPYCGMRPREKRDRRDY